LIFRYATYVTAFVSLSHIEELPMHIPRADIQRLKSILGLDSQEDIDAWHAFCAAHSDPAVQSEVLNPFFTTPLTECIARLVSAKACESVDPAFRQQVPVQNLGRQLEYHA
jgi:hypothetical protein